MPEVGSMTVGINAVGTKAAATFTSLKGQAGGLRAQLKALGDTKIGEGSAWVEGIRFVSQQTQEAVKHINELSAEASKAGMSLGEMTQGLINEEDAKKASAFADALTDLKTVFKDGKASIFIEVAPAAETAIRQLTQILDGIFRVTNWLQDRAKDVGTAVGNIVVPEDTGGRAHRARLLRSGAAGVPGGQAALTFFDRISERVDPGQFGRRKQRIEMDPAALAEEKKQTDHLEALREKADQDSTSGGATTTLKVTPEAP